MPKKQASLKSLVAEARAALAQSIGWNSRVAARRIAKFLDSRLEASGLSASQFDVMVQIAAAADDTLSALAIRLGVDQSTLSRNLQALEKGGLIEIAMIEKDLRRRAVWLTERGARALERAMPLWRNANALLGETIDSSQVLKLARAAENLQGN
jgi:DNA-binding MarR family transcriptional regulator